MVSKKTHLDPVDLVQIGNKDTKKQKKSTTDAPPSGHRCLLHPLPPNEEKQVHSKNLSLWNTFEPPLLFSLVSLFLFLSIFSPFLFRSLSTSSLFPSFLLPLLSFLSFLTTLSSFFYHSPFIFLLPSFLSPSCSTFSPFFLSFLFHYSCSSLCCSFLPPLLIFSYTCSIYLSFKLCYFFDLHSLLHL